jgi:hypothetical protein
VPRPRPPASTGVITTVAGDGQGGYVGDGGPATLATLESPAGIAVDRAGDLLIADEGNDLIRRVDHTSGDITTIAGNHHNGGGDTGDGGPATAATLETPTWVAVNGSGDVFISDSIKKVIRKVDHATGVITTIAGNDQPGYSGDGGPATAAEMLDPRGMATDGAGNLFIADGLNKVIREADHATGTITTAVGNGLFQYAGDVFIADVGNNRVRRVDHATGVISTVAGNGTSGYTGDGGPATAAELADVTNVAVDAAGHLFLSATVSNVVREVDLTSGTITTVAGNGQSGDTGDGGPATAAAIQAAGLAFDSAGDLFISGFDVVREVVATGLAVNVAKAPLTITGNDQSKPFGAPVPTLTASYSGFVNGDTPASVTTPPTLATTATALSPIGSYPITLSGESSSNYSLSYVNSTLDVTRVPPPVVGDLDGDGTSDPAVFDPTTSTFFLHTSRGNEAIQFGQGSLYGGHPQDVSARYEGGGITDAAVFEPSTSTF